MILVGASVGIFLATCIVIKLFDDEIRKSTLAKAICNSLVIGSIICFIIGIISLIFL